MLQEFLVNTNPAVGRALKICVFSYADFDRFRNLTCSCAGTLSKGKLVDYLSPSQFDSLVQVLSLLSSARDFRVL